MPWYSHPKNSSHELWTRLALTAFRWLHHPQKPFFFRGCFENFSPLVVGPRNPGFRDGYKMVQISYNFPGDHPNPCNSLGLQITALDGLDGLKLAENGLLGNESESHYNS